MKYHPEVCRYMESRVGEDIRMIEIIRFVMIHYPLKNKSKIENRKQRSAISEGCHASLKYLRERGIVVARRPKCFGGYGTYRWL